MKRYIRASTHKEWQSHLTSGVYNRLCECTTTKKDIPQLARCFWNYKAKQDGMTEQECLDYILTWVLDWNGGMWDYTEDEYDYWLSQIYPRRKKVESSELIKRTWMAKYTDIKGKVHKVAADLPTQDFDEATEMIDEIIREPYVKLVNLGTGNRGIIADDPSFTILEY